MKKKIDWGGASIVSPRSANAQVLGITYPWGSISWQSKLQVGSSSQSVAFLHREAAGGFRLSFCTERVSLLIVAAVDEFRPEESQIPVIIGGLVLRDVKFDQFVAKVNVVPSNL